VNTIQIPTIQLSNNPIGFALDIYSEIISALESEERVMLATIISTSGSTPASAFSKMLIKNEGNVSVGTVGGGCLEGDVLVAAKKLYHSEKAEILSFHLNEDEFVQGLICGGTVDILIEPISAKHHELFEKLKASRDQGEDAVILTQIGSGGKIIWKNMTRAESVFKDDPREDEVGRNMKMERVRENMRTVLRRNQTQRHKNADGEIILEPVMGSPSLVVFGGGHVSKYICECSSRAGFRVTIVDDRKEYANPQRFPEAVCTIAGDFLEVFAGLTVKPSTYIVIVTRGHRSDEEILEQAVKTPAKYIGMIGSKRKVLTTYEHLLERGVSIQALKRVHAPMGIEIGATTAEEIGVSVVSQLIAVRRSERSPYVDKSDAARELFVKLEKMIENTRQNLQ